MTATRSGVTPVPDRVLSRELTLHPDSGRRTPVRLNVTTSTGQSCEVELAHDYIRIGDCTVRFNAIAAAAWDARHPLANLIETRFAGPSVEVPEPEFKRVLQYTLGQWWNVKEELCTRKGRRRHVVRCWLMVTVMAFWAALPYIVYGASVIGIATWLVLIRR